MRLLTGFFFPWSACELEKIDRAGAARAEMPHEKEHTMQLPIDTANLTLLAGRIEPVMDFETRQPRADANGPVSGPTSR